MMVQNETMFEVFEHTADIGLRIRAPDRQSAYAEAAAALFSLLIANPQAVRGTVSKTYRIDGEQGDYLLFDWLNELLYTFETERLLLRDFRVELDDSGLVATCRGEPIDRTRHKMEHEVKAITYHELKLKQTADGWLAEVIVDI
jgi:SHS2 domain-containing protein